MQAKRILVMLSQYTRITTFKILLCQTASHVATSALLYSAFVRDSATVSCLLLLHDMAHLPREKMNPDVDHLSAL